MITVITDIRAFQEMREEWNRLLDASGSWNPFLTWEWMWAWWTHLRESATLHVVTVRDDGQLIAIAPLMSVRRGLSWRLEFIGIGAAGADYLDLIVRKGHEPAAVAALSRYLDEQQVSLHLDHLPPNPLAASLNLADWTAIEASPDVCPYIDLSGQTWDSYLTSLGPSHRANFRRRLRGLESKFTLSFMPVVAEDDRRRVTEGLFLFHDQRWTCGGSTAFSSTPLRAFHHDLSRSALESGWLRMYAVSLNDKLAATMYGFARDGRFYFYQHGYDEAYSRYSLGLVLMGLTIRAAIHDSMREFDMLYGNEPYKKLWAARQRPLGRLMLFPPRLAGRLLQRRVETRQAVRALIHRLGLHPTAPKTRGGAPGLKGSHDAA
jgi:CelD/BcsL family acetyltransferase involved in cellulose biosynthesis